MARKFTNSIDVSEAFEKEVDYEVVDDDWEAYCLSYIQEFDRTKLMPMIPDEYRGTGHNYIVAHLLVRILKAQEEIHGRNTSNKSESGGT